MPLSFSEILKEGPGPGDPAPAAGSSVPAAPPGGAEEKRLLDDVLKEVIGEISQEIQRIGEALQSRGLPQPAPAAVPPADLSPEPPAAPPLLEETLTAEERKALADLLREPPPPAPADPGNLPLGGFAPEPPQGEPDAAGPAPAQVPPPSEGQRETQPPGGSGVWISPPAVRQALEVETDAGIMEVEDLIKIHMAAYAEDERKDKEDQEKAGRAAAAAAGAELLSMVRPRRASLLARFDAWVVTRGLARHKRRVGVVAWAILIGTMIGVAVTLWMRR